MEQMVNEEAPVLHTMQAGRLSSAFIRREAGKIFYLSTVGRSVNIFPVRADRLVSRTGESLFPAEDVKIIHPDDLDIKEVKWA